MYRYFGNINITYSIGKECCFSHLSIDLSIDSFTHYLSIHPLIHSFIYFSSINSFIYMFIYTFLLLIYYNCIYLYITLYSIVSIHYLINEPSLLTTVLMIFCGLFVNGPYACITTAVSSDLVRN